MPRLPQPATPAWSPNSNAPWNEQWAARNNAVAMLEWMWNNGQREQAVAAAIQLGQQWGNSGDPILQQAALALAGTWMPRQQELQNPPASAPAPAPAQPAQPAGPSVDPFFTPEDLAAINAFITNYQQQGTSLDRALADLNTDTAYQKTNVERSATQNRASATEAMVARGLFESSVKDAAIYDIEAQRALQQKFLDDRLTTATLDNENQHRILDDSKRRFDEAMAAKQVENARAIAATMPPAPSTSPAPAPAPTPAPSAPNTTVPKGNLPATPQPQPTGPREIPAGLRPPRIASSGPQPTTRRSPRRPARR